MSAMTVTIDMGKKCAECGKGGAAPSGLCMSCASKAMDSGRLMKSDAGKAVQRRWIIMKRNPR